MTRTTLRSPLVPVLATIVALAALTAACDSGTDIETIETGYTPGEVVTGLVAPATGGGSPFDGVVNTAADLENLAETAYGEAALDLHRGHMPVQNVLEAYLGISHTSMHEYINQGDNLAATAQDLGYSVDGLIQSLVNGFTPYIEQGVSNGVITQAEVATWTARIRTEFTNRVYWDGQS